MTPQEKSKDKRLWKCYRWTLAMYNALGERQHWRCAICGREALTMPLNVDHEHFKIESRRIITDYPAPEKMWESTTKFKDGRTFRAVGLTKTLAIEALNDLALPASVRGLLCAGRYAGCNRKLGSIDNILWLKNSITYLEHPPAQGPTLEERSAALSKAVHKQAIRMQSEDSNGLHKNLF
jgi:hypothetical protein